MENEKEHSKLSIHKGKDPSIEMKFIDEDIDELNSIKILFPGDMERQKFVEAVILIHRNGEGKEDKDDID